MSIDSDVDHGVRLMYVDHGVHLGHINHGVCLVNVLFPCRP